MGKGWVVGRTSLPEVGLGLGAGSGKGDPRLEGRVVFFFFTSVVGAVWDGPGSLEASFQRGPADLSRPAQRRPDPARDLLP